MSLTSLCRALTLLHALVQVTRREDEFDDDEYDYARYIQSQQARPALSLWGYDVSYAQRCLEGAMNAMWAAVST